MRRVSSERLSLVKKLFDELNEDGIDSRTIEQNEKLSKKISTLTEEDLRIVFTI